MTITILTPTYNRAELLDRLYHSLCQQTFENFEWVIVNDGSEDNTEDVVQSFIDEGKIKIKYIKQENGGKHRAVNRGVKEADGELLFIADSDDWLPKDALQDVWKTYNPIKNNDVFAGVCGLDGFEDGNLVGTELPQDIIDGTPGEIRYIYGVKGDMKEVYKTDVLRKYPFPEIVGEKFCPEMEVWHRIANNYKLRFFNKVIYLAEYQEHGITDSIVEVRQNSPVSTMLAYKAKLMTNVPIKQKIKSAINFYRFKYCLSKTHREEVLKNGCNIPQIPIKWRFFAPIGLLFHLKDKHL